MKKCLILLAVALSGTIAKADNFALKVNLYGSTSAMYVLDSKPVITYSDNSIIIKNQSLEDTYPISEVESFTFVETPASGIEKITDNITYEFRNNVFTCEGQYIRVFNLSGHAVSEGNSSVSLEALADGLYIISAGNRTIKVIKK